MNIQEIFYVLGSLFMTLGIGLLIGIVILLFYIKNKISDIHTNIENKINSISTLASHSGEIAANIGASLVQSATKRLATSAKKKRR